MSRKSATPVNTLSSGLQNVVTERQYLYIGSFCVLIIIYFCLSLIPAPVRSTLHHYNLSNADYRWLILPIVIFLTAIWVAALYGSLRVKSYANLIRRSRDGRAFDTLANGIVLLAIMLPFTSDLSSLVKLIARHAPAANEALTIINNYIDLLLMGWALLVIARGADKLAAQAAGQHKSWSEQVWVTMFIIFSSLYGYFLVGQPASTSAADRIYFLPHWLLLISLAMPYLYFWYRGLKGAHQVFFYQKHVRGSLYKQALRYLAAGIAIVIFSSIATRALATVSSHLSHLSLTPILVIIYALLGVIAAGYLLIAWGAKKLRRLEEV